MYQIILEYLVHLVLDSVILHIGNNIEALHGVSITDCLAITTVLFGLIYWKGQLMLDYVKQHIRRAANYIRSRLK
ncbi:hypothetical protein [Paenibacillus bovis]|uniref:Uncharacterized protein n=1 Tax=Paenibacillus bovis TaxID=1616788 RepID=A0A1X9T3Z8_9BACL|nr:hypothetical protein [Paenibacillus bovis]ARR10624.1 hypothetical protein AR543_p0016 [Paenibacillus bovis]